MDVSYSFSIIEEASHRHIVAFASAVAAAPMALSAILLAKVPPNYQEPELMLLESVSEG